MVGNLSHPKSIEEVQSPTYKFLGLFLVKLNTSLVKILNLLDKMMLLFANF